MTRKKKPYCECHEDRQAHYDAYVQAVVDRAPPLTEAQKATLTAVFRSVGFPKAR